MKLRTVVQIYWVPGHMGIEENKKADEATKVTTERVGTRRYPERFTLLTHFKRTILERK